MDWNFLKIWFLAKSSHTPCLIYRVMETLSWKKEVVRYKW